MTAPRPSLDERLGKHPHLRERFESILAIVEDTADTIDLADEAERLAIIEVRQLGAAMLHEWARTKELQKSTEMGVTEKNAIRNGKKNSIGVIRLRLGFCTTTFFA
jgi:hypothetical protein